MAYTLLETYTVPSGGASSIEFDPIEGVDGADLKVLISARSNASGIATEYRFQFNGDTSSVYYTTSMAGDGSGINRRGVGPTSFLENLSLQKNGATANTFGNAELYISNFSSAQDTYASFMAVSENNASEAYQGVANFYRDVAEAITSIKIYATVGDFMEHTTASLYLVTTADASGATVPLPKATGGSITKYGSYWVHTFESTGIFRPTEALTDCEYLIVAGGGGGGAYVASYGGGGGGAGGYRTRVVGATSGGGASAEARIGFAADTDYQVTIGAGGAQRASSGSGVGYDGNASSLANSSTTVTSVGGGGGGAEGNAGNTGGSGGGAGGANTGSPIAGGSGTVNQGRAGGQSTGQSGAGGGGGAVVGANQTGNSNAVVGGAGVVATIDSGTTVFRAGGGASGFYYGAPNTPAVGGSGGGGATGAAATANTGGGGGGGSQSNEGSPVLTGGAGGSGIVIVRYLA